VINHQLMQDCCGGSRRRRPPTCSLRGLSAAIKLEGDPAAERARAHREQSATLCAIMNDRQTKEFDATKECNSRSPRRHRPLPVSAFVQQRGRLVIRLINAKIPTSRNSTCPDLKRCAQQARLVIVVGAPFGKSTTLDDGRVPQRQDAGTSSPSRIRSNTCTPTRLRDHAPRGRVDTTPGLRAQEHLRQARSDPDRRSATRDHGVRIQFSETGHLCWPLCTPTGQFRRSTHHQFLPRRARPAAHGSVAQHPRAGVAALIPREAGSAHRPMEIMLNSPLIQT